MVRTLSGAVFVTVMVFGTLLSAHAFSLLTMVICAGCLWEFYRLAEKCGARPQKGLSLALSLLPLAVCYLVMATGATAGSMALMMFPVGIMAIFVVELYRKQENPLGNVAATFAGMFYVTMPMLFFMFLPTEFGHITGKSLICVVWLLVIVWANDVGAYLVGVTFGRHRLMERISPKKSWEGFFGGMAFAILAGIAAGMTIDKEWIFWIVLAVLTTISGVWGDLVESMFKRSAGVKDSGSIMPGHGGFLDRFDALLFAAPVALAWIKLFSIF